MATRHKHITDTLQAALANELSFTVNETLEKERYRDAGKTQVYVNIIQDDKDNTLTESGWRMLAGYATCGIFCQFTQTRDMSGAGTATAVYADIIEKIEEQLAVLDDEATAGQHITTSTYWQTIITGIEPLRHSGFVDDASNNGRLLYEVRVHYKQDRV